jgi:hypothetical protein
LGVGLGRCQQNASKRPFTPLRVGGRDVGFLPAPPRAHVVDQSHGLLAVSRNIVLEFRRE